MLSLEHSKYREISIRQYPVALSSLNKLLFDTTIHHPFHTFIANNQSRRCTVHLTCSLVQNLHKIADGAIAFRQPL